MDFAYNEASFILIKILQKFDRFTLAQAESAPLDCLPPPEWKARQGRQAFEEFYPGQGITMYAKVRRSAKSAFKCRTHRWFVGWHVASVSLCGDRSFGITFLISYGIFGRRSLANFNK